MKIQCEHDVAYAGALAGYPIGMAEISGNRILVTSEARLIEPKQGDWPVLKQVMDNLFNDPKYDQQPHVWGWLKIALKSLRARVIRPGQALVIAGEHESGKSLVQNLTTEILGGRAAKPYRYMSGGTEFNADLFGAEHLMIEDDVASTDMRKRMGDSHGLPVSLALCFTTRKTRVSKFKCLL